MSARTTTDVLVVGATGGGIAAAIRAAREGLEVTLTERTGHIGGLLSGGLGVMDTQYDGKRAPIYDELCERVVAHYVKRYGAGSEQVRNVLPRPAWPLTFEPHAIEQVLTEMVAEHPGVTVLLSTAPLAVERRGRTLAAVRFAGPDGEVTVAADTFIDATYEADLAALAGAAYRVGREGRSEFGEPHAGRLFTKQGLTADGLGAWPAAAVETSLNLRQFKSISREIFAGSTGEGDAGVQAYSYRLTLSSDPDNRRMPERPDGYDPALYRRLDKGAAIGAVNLPNNKRFWFRNFPGANWAYPDADETGRETIRRRHRDFSLGYLYFLQNDDSVPEALQAEARQWGLARDEFVDNDNFPYELYVREARRLRGRYVFSEHDGSLAPGLERTPVHHDAIAFAEWPMDSHEVSEEVQPGSSREGKFLLTEITRPSQIPYRCLLPEGIDNLLVPVCLSSTHVGWGTLRLEPVWMHVGEVAGWAAAQAADERKPAAEISTDRLQRTLVGHQVGISFFNDVDCADAPDWVPAVNWAGSRGLFASYDARPTEPLSESLARQWCAAILAPRGTAMDVAHGVAAADTGPAVSGRRFAELCVAAATLAGRTVAPPAVPEQPSRADACRALFDLSAP